MNNIPKTPKSLINYLYTTGIFLHIAILGALITAPLIIHEPLAFFIERTANYLNHSGGSAKQRHLGRLLLQYLPINDWQSPQISQLPLLTSLENWKGQGASKKISYSVQQYLGRKPLKPVYGVYKGDVKKTKMVYNSKEFITALNHAKPGDTIQLMPGSYPIKQRYINIKQAGLSTDPIIVRSAQLGTVKIELTSSEGFHILAPYWVFENLEIQGHCTKKMHGYCDHAFHVTGNGHSFVLKNNKIHDFNSAVKVNGSSVNGKSVYPDYGLIEKNSFYNTTPRYTNSPVNLLNINSANNWVVRSNLISDFSKKGGNNLVSFGAYMKGNSHNGLFENNLIICEHTLPADLGIRIGLSFGGGGTGTRFCRDTNCDSEHTNGIMRNNIILNCSHDIGIYLNKAKNTKIYNNLIFNSLGIDARFNTTSAFIYNNIISGRIKSRNGGTYTSQNNLIDQDCIAPDRLFSNCSFIDWYWDVINADLELRQVENRKLKTVLIQDNLKTDFCNNPRNYNESYIGPIEYGNNLNCLPDKMQDRF